MKTTAKLSRHLVALSAVAACTAPTASFAGDPYAGEVKAAACLPCHGTGDTTQSNAMPIISGQYEDYIAQALRSYKTGERNDPVMMTFALPLTETDIRDISAFYAEMESRLFTPKN